MRFTKSDYFIEHEQIMNEIDKIDDAAGRVLRPGIWFNRLCLDILRTCFG